MPECVKVKPIAVCPVCSKSEKEEIAAALADTLAQIEKLKRQARAWKSRLRSIGRKEAKIATTAASPQPSTPPATATEESASV